MALTSRLRRQAYGMKRRLLQASLVRYQGVDRVLKEGKSVTDSPYRECNSPSLMSNTARCPIILCGSGVIEYMPSSGKTNSTTLSLAIGQDFDILRSNSDLKEKSMMNS